MLCVCGGRFRSVSVGRSCKNEGCERACVRTGVRFNTWTPFFFNKKKVVPFSVDFYLFTYLFFGYTCNYHKIK